MIKVKLVLWSAFLHLSGLHLRVHVNDNKKNVREKPINKWKLIPTISAKFVLNKPKTL